MALKIGNGLDLQSQKIINQADPTNPQDSATKAYVDNVARGLEWHQHVRVLAATNITISSPGASIDGVSMAAGDRILLTAQSTGSQNGLWVWNASASALTRPTDYAAAQVLTKGSVTVTVTEGTQADKVWTMTTDGTVTVDTTTTAWATVGGGTTYTAGNGLTGSTTFSVLANGTSIDVSASGVKIADAAAGTGLGVSAGILSVNTASGITTSGDNVVLDTSVAARKFSITTTGSGWTGGAAKTINHALNSTSVVVQLYIVSTGELVIADVVVVDANNVTVTVATSQSDGFYRVIVIG